MRTFRYLTHVAAGMTALLAAAQAAPCQTVLHKFYGDAEGDYLGRSVDGAGDVNADGIDDVIVGAWNADNNGLNSGSAWVYSGADGSVLYRFDGYQQQVWLGETVAGLGDVNGDGYGDVAVATSWDYAIGPWSGSVWVYSGRDGSLRWKHDGPPGSFFGTALDGVGDVDGDGAPDVLVGAPFAQTSGAAYLYSGRTGATLFTFYGDPLGVAFGESVAYAGDVDGDGVGDVIVGDPRDATDGPYSGSVKVFSGADGSVLIRVHGDSDGDRFGLSVAGIGDVNGDGTPDVLVGAPEDSKGGRERSGSVRAVSGADGSTLYEAWIDGESTFGRSAAGLGDVNMDGVGDFVVGTDGGYPVYVLSGRDGGVLTNYKGSVSGYRASVALAGDVNVDGFPDFIVGQPGDDKHGLGTGVARVVSACHPMGKRYCTPARPNSTGVQATIRACGSGKVQRNYLSLSATRLPADSFGFFLASQTRGLLPGHGGGQGDLCLAGDVGSYSHRVLASGASGSFQMMVDLTDVPPPAQSAVFPGEKWCFQAWFRDRNPGPTSNFTDAVAVSFW